MNTTSIIGLIAAVIIVGGGVWYFSSHGNAPAGTPAVTNSASNGSGTFASLMALAGSVKCNVATATTANQAESSGTVYISNGQMRGDFNATNKALGDTVIEAHMIRAGGFIYSWSSAAPQGVKMSDAVIENASTKNNASGSIDPNAQVSYSCEPWVADAAQFVPPSTVTFMDVSAMMQGKPTGAMPVKGTTYPQGPTNKPYAY